MPEMNNSQPWQCSCMCPCLRGTLWTSALGHHLADRLSLLPCSVVLRLALVPMLCEAVVDSWLYYWWVRAIVFDFSCCWHGNPPEHCNTPLALVCFLVHHTSDTLAVLISPQAISCGQSCHTHAG